MGISKTETTRSIDLFQLLFPSFSRWEEKHFFPISGDLRFEGAALASCNARLVQPNL